MSKPYENVVPMLPEREPIATETGSGAWISKELTRVEEANLAFYEAFHNLDLHAMSTLWAKSPHARCIHPGWELVIGWAEIRQSWQEIFRTLEAIEFHIGDIHVEVSGRSAWVNLVAHVDVQTDTGENFQAAVVATNMFELVDGDWRLVLHHSSNFLEVEDEDDDLLDESDYGSRPGSGSGSGSNSSSKPN